MTVLSEERDLASARSILLLSFATFSSMASQRICDAMLPELARVFDAPLSQAARVVSVFAVVYGLLQVFYGPLGDRLGKFRVIAWATLACSCGNLMAAFAGSLDALVLARAVSAAGAAAIIPLGLAWIGDVAPPGRLQVTIARVGLGTALGVGSGQLIGGWLSDTLGWRWAFGVLAVLFSGVGLLLLADWRRQLTASPPGHTVSGSGSTQGFMARSFGVLRQSWPRTVVCVGVAEGAAGFGALAMWASFLHHDRGFSLSAAGAVVALFGAGGVCYMASARWVIPRMPQPRMAWVGGLIVAGAGLIMAFGPMNWMSVPASLLAGYGFFAFHNVMQANAAQMTPESRGTAVALFAASLFAGQSIGVTVAAALAEHVGGGPVIALGGAMMGVLGVVLAVALRRRSEAVASQDA